MEHSDQTFSNIPLLRLLDKIQSTFERTMASTGLILATLILVVSRIYAIISGYPILWASELSRYVMVWTVFIGASALMRLTQHVRLDFFLRRMSKKAEAFIEMFIYLVAGVFLLYVTYVGWNTTSDVFKSHETIFYTRVSQGWVYLGFPVGVFLMAINAFKIFMLKRRAARKLMESSQE